MKGRPRGTSSLRFGVGEGGSQVGKAATANAAPTSPEWALNRAGIAVFALGVVVSLAV